MRLKAEFFDQLQRLFDLNGLNDHQLHGVLRFEQGAAPDVGLLRRAFIAMLGAVPILGSRYVAEPQPYWETLEPATFEGAFVTTRSAAEFDAFLVRRADEERGPQMRLCWLEADAPAAAITLNHMVCDGAGLKACLYLLSEIATRLADNPAHVPPRLDGDRSAAALVGRFPLTTRIRSLLTDARDNRSGERTFPLAPASDADVPFIATRRIARERTGAVRAHARSCGATLNDAVLAAYYRCLFRALDVPQGDGLTVPIMVDMRRYLAQDGGLAALTNLSSMAATELRRRAAEPFDATLTRVAAMTAAKKGRAIGVNSVFKLDWLFRLLGDARANRMIRRGLDYPLICMTNIGVLDERRLSFAGAAPCDAFVCGSIKYKPYFQLALSTYREEITLSCNLYGGSEDRRRIEGFLVEVQAEMGAGAD